MHSTGCLYEHARPVHLMETRHHHGSPPLFVPVPLGIQLYHAVHGDLEVWALGRLDPLQVSEGIQTRRASQRWVKALCSLSPWKYCTLRLRRKVIRLDFHGRTAVQKNSPKGTTVSLERQTWAGWIVMANKQFVERTPLNDNDDITAVPVLSGHVCLVLQ